MAFGRFSLPAQRRRVSSLLQPLQYLTACVRLTRLVNHAGAQNKVVSVWILDKRPPSSVGSGGRWEQVVELCRKDAAALTRLKHPAIVKVSFQSGLSKACLSRATPANPAT